MSQTFADLVGSGTLQTDRTTLNNNIGALRSSFSGSSAPSSPTPVEGQLWADSTNDFLYIYDGSSWRQVVKYSSSSGYHQSSFDIAANTTFAPYFTATQTIRLMSAAQAITITAVQITSDTSAATDASNYYTFALQNGGTAGSSSTAICSQTTNSSGGAAITANTSYSLGTISNANIAANEQLKIVCTKTGTPTALATARVYITIQWRTN